MSGKGKEVKAGEEQKAAGEQPIQVNFMAFKTEEATSPLRIVHGVRQNGTRYVGVTGKEANSPILFMDTGNEDVLVFLNKLQGIGVPVQQIIKRAPVAIAGAPIPTEL